MFELVTESIITGNNEHQNIAGFTTPFLMISLDYSRESANGFPIERSWRMGKVFKVRWSQSGYFGSFNWIGYGSNEILFSIPYPDQPFTLELCPNRYQRNYSYKIFRKRLDQNLIDLAALLSVDPVVLQGLPVHLTQLISGLNTMAQSDTRTAAAAILAAQNAATIAQTTADLANQTIVSVTDELNTVKSTVVSVTEDMVTQDSFSINASDFVMVGDFYHAIKPLVKVSGATPVQMSLTDSLGEEQGFSQLISPYLGDSMKACVEFNASQFADNTYPLTFCVQGKRISSVAGNSGNVIELVGFGLKYRYNPSVSNGCRSEERRVGKRVLMPV